MLDHQSELARMSFLSAGPTSSSTAAPIGIMLASGHVVTTCTPV